MHPLYSFIVGFFVSICKIIHFLFGYVKYYLYICIKYLKV